MPMASRSCGHGTDSIDRPGGGDDFLGDRPRDNRSSLPTLNTLPGASVGAP
jgi:hypothetical protein